MHFQFVISRRSVQTHHVGDKCALYARLIAFIAKSHIACATIHIAGPLVQQGYGALHDQFGGIFFGKIPPQCLRDSGIDLQRAHVIVGTLKIREIVIKF